MISLYIIRRPNGDYITKKAGRKDDISKAFVFDNISAARSCITSIAMRDPNDPANVCQLIKLVVKDMIVVDEGDRVKKCAIKARKRHLNERIHRLEYSLNNRSYFPQDNNKIQAQIENLKKELEQLS